MMLSALTNDIGHEHFLEDPHAAKYRDEIARRPEACARLFALLNDPANEQRLIDAQTHKLPALCGIVRFIEADPVIEHVLAEGRAGHRFRQTVGVAVKLKMSRLGWQPTGRKGTVRGAEYFRKAEHYAPGPIAGADLPSRALEALEAVTAIGDDDERTTTGRALMEALAASRRAEGRAF